MCGSLKRSANLNYRCLCLLSAACKCLTIRWNKQNRTRDSTQTDCITIITQFVHLLEGWWMSCFCHCVNSLMSPCFVDRLKNKTRRTKNCFCATSHFDLREFNQCEDSWRYWRDSSLPPPFFLSFWHLMPLLLLYQSNQSIKRRGSLWYGRG